MEPTLSALALESVFIASCGGCSVTQLCRTWGQNTAQKDIRPAGDPKRLAMVLPATNACSTGLPSLWRVSGELGEYFFPVLNLPSCEKVVRILLHLSLLHAPRERL